MTKGTLVSALIATIFMAGCTTTQTLSESGRQIEMKKDTGIVIGSDWYQSLGNTNSLGIIFGLVLGKPVGIIFFSMLAVYLGLASLPEGVIWRQFVGVGVLGGIGFTMSIFITLLAFNQPELITQSKIAVIIASLFSGLAGYVLLKKTTKKNRIIHEPGVAQKFHKPLKRNFN